MKPEEINPVQNVPVSSQEPSQPIAEMPNTIQNNPVEPVATTPQEQIKSQLNHVQENATQIAHDLGEKAKNVKAPKLKINKGILIAGGVLIGFLLLMVVMLSMFGGIPNNPITGPIVGQISPTPTPTQAPVITSTYADDEEVKAIIESVNELENKLNSTNLREDTLRVPNVDWDIKF